jgi:hypothetical protein
MGEIIRKQGRRLVAASVIRNGASEIFGLKPQHFTRSDARTRHSQAVDSLFFPICFWQECSVPLTYGGATLIVARTHSAKRNWQILTTFAGPLYLLEVLSHFLL